MAKFKKSNLMKVLSLTIAIVLTITAFTGCGGKKKNQPLQQNQQQLLQPNHQLFTETP